MFGSIHIKCGANGSAPFSAIEWRVYAEFYCATRHSIVVWPQFTELIIVIYVSFYELRLGVCFCIFVGVILKCPRWSFRQNLRIIRDEKNMGIYRSVRRAFFELFSTTVISTVLQNLIIII